MFSFFSKKKPSSTTYLGMLQTDMHSHLLPGIDDGAPDIDSSVALIKGMMLLGYSRLITTPHIMWDMYPNTHEIIGQKLNELNDALVERGIEMKVHAAAEYFLDENVERLLKTKTPLLTLSKNMVLTEFSLAFEPHGLKDILFEMQMQGYLPVIAHPERYIYQMRNKAFFDELKDAGYYFQLNILSLTGYYGKGVQELAQYLIKKGYYDLIGSDLHGERHLKALQNPQLEKQIGKLMETGKILNPEL